MEEKGGGPWLPKVEKVEKAGNSSVLVHREVETIEKAGNSSVLVHREVKTIEKIE